MSAEEHHKFIDWRIRHDVIAGSASYVLNGDPKLQVSTLRETLKQAETEGVDRRKIYDSIYDDLHRHQPHFPDPLR
jgi:hypothetical protein